MENLLPMEQLNILLSKVFQQTGLGKQCNPMQLDQEQCDQGLHCLAFRQYPKIFCNRLLKMKLAFLLQFISRCKTFTSHVI